MSLIPNPPLRDVRKEYVARVTPGEGGGWSVCHVDIVHVAEAGDEQVVYSYDRNYSFLHTFEPFRQLRGDAWHDYALISPRYSTFQVLDLANGEVVATRPYPQQPWHPGQYERSLAAHPEWFEPGGHYAGKGPEDTIAGEGFCPVDFYVPDFASEMELGGADGAADAAKYSEKEWWQEDLGYKTGQFAFYSGCLWGDDSSWKLRYIDLSRISEGVVTDEERFGYWQLPHGRLKDMIEYDEGMLRMPRDFYVDIDNGHVHGRADDITWTK